MPELILKSKIKIASDGLSLKVYDKTGDYVAVTNEGGYGFPNISVGSVNTAVFSIQLPGVVTPVVIDVYPTLPSTNTALYYSITNVMLGLGELEVIPDGYIQSTYTISGVDGFAYLYMTQSYIYNTRSISCCIHKMVAKQAAIPSTGNSSGFESKANQAMDVLQNICASAGCNDIVSADNNLKIAQKLCPTGDCGCGCN